MKRKCKNVFIFLWGVLFVTNNLDAQDSTRIDSLRVITVGTGIILEDGVCQVRNRYPYILISEKTYTEYSESYEWNSTPPKEVIIANEINAQIAKKRPYPSWELNHSVTGIYSYNTFTVTKNENGLLCLEMIDHFQGPNRSDTDIVILTFDINKAKLLILEDDVIESDSLPTFIDLFRKKEIKVLKKNLSDSPFDEWLLERLDWISNTEVISFKNWCVRNDELIVNYYNGALPYEGVQSFKIEEIKHLLRPEFLMFFDLQ